MRKGASGEVAKAGMLHAPQNREFIKAVLLSVITKANPNYFGHNETMTEVGVGLSKSDKFSSPWKVEVSKVESVIGTPGGICKLISANACRLLV